MAAFAGFATDRSQLIPQSAQKFPHQKLAPGEWQDGQIRFQIRSGSDAVGDTRQPRDDTSKPRDKDGKARSAEPVRQQAALKPAAEDKIKAAPEEKRDANELARAAIERLRGAVDTANASGPGQQGARAGIAQSPQPVQEPAPVVMQTPLVQRAPAATASMVAPLPPPVIVAAPYGRRPATQEPVQPSGPEEARPPQAARAADRPVPPAEIPASQRPFDIQAEAAPVEHASLAEHVLATTKSLFRALTPH